MMNFINNNTKLNRFNFNKWFNEGNAFRVGANQYKEQTTQYKKTFTLEELELFFIKEYQTIV